LVVEGGVLFGSSTSRMRRWVTAEVLGHLVTSSSRKTGFPDPAFFID